MKQQTTQQTPASKIVSREESAKKPEQMGRLDASAKFPEIKPGTKVTVSFRSKP